MTSTNETKKLPGPIYAAAGAGELAMEQLRKLPAQLEEFKDRTKLNERLAVVREDIKTVGEKVKAIDTDRLRLAASKAQNRAKETYGELVARGERVAAGERSPIKVMATIAKKDKAETVAPAAPAATVVEEPAPKPKRAPRAKKASS